MGVLTVVLRVVGRTASTTFVTRVGRRYPIVTVALIALRWWRRRSTRTQRTVVRIRPGESLTISDRSR